MMNKVSDMHLVSIIALSMAIGCVMTLMISYDKISSNEVGGYHCQPITTHTTLESAKGQVNLYHAMTGVNDE